MKSKTTSKTLTVIEADDSVDIEMGKQLTEVADRVKRSRIFDIIMGQMGLKVRERLFGFSEKPKHKGMGRYEAGSGLKGWLAKYAPSVCEGSLYPMMTLVEGLKNELNLRTVDLEKLLVADVSDLDSKMVKQRAKILAVIEGKSRRQLLLQFEEFTDRRARNPGGFRPNLLFLRAWLRQEYPAHPDLEKWRSVQFFELPEEIQKRYRAEGTRYEHRLTIEQRAEIEREAEAQDWLTRMPEAVSKGMLEGFEDYATDVKLKEFFELLSDYRSQVERKLSKRKGVRVPRAIANN